MIINESFNLTKMQLNQESLQTAVDSMQQLLQHYVHAVCDTSRHTDLITTRTVSMEKALVFFVLLPWLFAIIMKTL